MSGEIRFRPPPLEITPELGWVLRRSFGRPEARSPQEIDPTVALDLADLLRLAPRIWPRNEWADLELEVGRSAARSLQQRFAETVARGAVRIRALERLLELARTLETPIAVLKHEALRLGGHTSEGSRSAGDVDILVADGKAEALHARLRADDYEPLVASRPEHHLQTLVHARWGMVEVHVRLPGVRRQSYRSLGFDQLADADLLSAVPGGPPHLFIPKREVLAAHALTHGLVQHGHQPDSYPMMRLYADLIDLGIGSENDGELLESIASLAVPAISPEELRAARTLCAALLAGLPTPPPGSLDPGADTLLRHALAGRLDETYQQSLRLDVFTRGMSDRPQVLVAIERVWQSAFPSRQTLAALYGPAAGRMASAAQRVRHLGRLTGRLAGALRARLRLNATVRR